MGKLQGCLAAPAVAAGFMFELVTGAYGRQLRDGEAEQLRRRFEAVPGIARAAVDERVNGGGLGYHLRIELDGAPDQGAAKLKAALEQVRAILEEQRPRLRRLAQVRVEQRAGDRRLEVDIHPDHPRWRGYEQAFDRIDEFHA